MCQDNHVRTNAVHGCAFVITGTECNHWLNSFSPLFDLFGVQGILSFLVVYLLICDASMACLVEDTFEMLSEGKKEV